MRVGELHCCLTKPGPVVWQVELRETGPHLTKGSAPYPFAVIALWNPGLDISGLALDFAVWTFRIFRIGTFRIFWIQWHCNRHRTAGTHTLTSGPAISVQAA